METYAQVGEKLIMLQLSSQVARTFHCERILAEDGAALRQQAAEVRAEAAKKAAAAAAANEE